MGDFGWPSGGKAATVGLALTPGPDELVAGYAIAKFSKHIAEAGKWAWRGLVKLMGKTPKSSIAAKALATETNEAVFWSGIRGGDKTAASWVSRHGGSTLETTMAKRGINLPTWDPNNPATVAAWRNVSAEFAGGARGNIRVLQSDAVRVKSVWAEVEFPALKANPNVTSITAVNPNTGAEVILWSK